MNEHNLTIAEADNLKGKVEQLIRNNEVKELQNDATQKTQKQI
jgi:hypothetical protein